MRKLEPGWARGLVSIIGCLGVALVSGCNANSGSGVCTPLAASKFTECEDPDECNACEDPAQCIAAIAGWCTPGLDGEVLCATNNVDLTLVTPVLLAVQDPDTPDEFVTVEVGRRVNGCVHGGDERAEAPLDRDEDGSPGPFEENLTCSPYEHEMDPPDRLDDGLYVFQVVDNFSFFDTGDVRVDVYVNGATSCEFVNVDNGTKAEIEVTYPPPVPPAAE